MEEGKGEDRGWEGRRDRGREERNHAPVYLFCRPVWLEFPRDKNTYEMEDQFMVGRNLMVKPVTEQYATTSQLYLPGSSSVSFCYPSKIHVLMVAMVHTVSQYV